MSWAGIIRVGLLAAAAAAAAGCSDEPAPCDGCVFVEGYAELTQVTSLALDREDRLLAAVEGVGTDCPLSIARMDRDGELDPDFGAGGKAKVHAIQHVNGIVAMPDGSIRLGGDDDEDFYPGIVGLTAGGRLDESIFLVAAGVRGSALRVMEQDGALVVARVRRATEEAHLVRYTVAGDPAPVFSADPLFPPVPAEVATAVAPGGGYFLGGSYADGAQRRFRARRVTRFGEPEPGFGGGAPVTIPGVARAPGRILVEASAAGGMILAGVADPARPALLVARLDAAGRLDPSFGGGRGLVTLDVLEAPDVRALVEAPGGGILVAGGAGDGPARRAAAVRLTADGALDPAFGDGGVFVVEDEGSLFTSAVLARDGEIVAGGHAQRRAMLARFPAP